jgi:hypothetical protein
MTGYPESGPSLQMFPPPTSRTTPINPPPSSDRYSGRLAPPYYSTSLPENMRPQTSAAIPSSISRPGSTSQLGYMPYRGNTYYHPQMRGLSPPPQNNNPNTRDARWPRAPSGLNIESFQHEDEPATPIAISDTNQPMSNYAKDRASSNKYECEDCGKGFTRPSSLKVLAYNSPTSL